MPDIIETNPKILGGQPIIKGTRIPIARVMALIGMGYTLSKMKRELPDLKKITKKDIATILLLPNSTYNIKHQKLKFKKVRKFKLLLDSAFAKPSDFKKLSKKSKLTHIRHTYNLSPETDDKEIYEVAIREDSFVVTQNYKDFKRLVKKEKPGILSVPSYLSTNQMDELLTKFISGKNPDDYVGKAVKI